MNNSIILTVFLAVSGVFTFWCALKNYDWFFNFPGPSQLFIQLIGRTPSRIVYLFFSIILLGWGITRIISPPPKIPTDFIYQLAKPDGINLSEPTEATLALNKIPPSLITQLQYDQAGWISFWKSLSPDTPIFSQAAASTTAGPDFDEGFTLRKRSYNGMQLEGRILYFDAQSISCDNIIFSSRPLSSASFAMIICTPEASKKNGFGNSLAIFYCRAGTPLYKKLIR